MADARNFTPKLGADKREITSSLLQGPDNEQGQADYIEHGSEIIDIVEGLENTFADENADLKELQIGTAEKNLECAETRGAEFSKDIASTNFYVDHIEARIGH